LQSFVPATIDGPADEQISVDSRPPDEQAKTKDCLTLVRRVTGPHADELFFVCRPESPAADVAAQAVSAYAAMLDLLASQGVSPESVVSETLFVADVQADTETILDRRRRVLERSAQAPFRPPTAVVGQPPLIGGASLELAVCAVVRRGPREPARPSNGDLSFPATVYSVGGQTHLHAGNIYGSAKNAFDQAYEMFCAGEQLLNKAGMDFHHVVRTWIYLRDMDRDYAEFNRARREFFRSRAIDLKPASTAVGGIPYGEDHDFCLRLHAVKSPSPLTPVVMSTPTLNEAWTYGSDFSRGLKIEEANKVTVYISGTASVDEAGYTVHVGDVEAQAERMLVNIAALLETQGASFGDLVSAVAYVKESADVEKLRTIFHKRGFEGFPCTFVESDICRPELLCETEAVAVLPLPASSGSGKGPRNGPRHNGGGPS